MGYTPLRHVRTCTSAAEDNLGAALLILLGLALLLWPMPTHGRETAFTVTAYCPASDYAHGLTRSGVRPVEGVTVACDPAVIPLQTAVSVPALASWVSGAGRFICEDTGSKVRGHHLDIRMDDCVRARAFGRRKLTGRIHVGALALPWSSPGCPNLPPTIGSLSMSQGRQRRDVSQQLAASGCASPPCTLRRAPQGEQGKEAAPRGGAHDHRVGSSFRGPR